MAEDAGKSNDNPPKRVIGIPFVKGKSGNPSGRPRNTLAPIIKEATEDGEELVRIQLEIARGELLIERRYIDKDGNERTIADEPSYKDRQSAIEWLTDRAWGRAVQTHELGGLDGQATINVALHAHEKDSQPESASDKPMD